MQKLDLGRVVGLSAYEVAVKNGYEGTEAEWIESLKYDHSDEFESYKEAILKAIAEFEDDKDILDTDMATIKTYVENAYTQIEAKRTSALSDIESSETSALSNITSAKTTALSNITSSETSALNSIESAKTSSVSAIESAQTSGVNELNSVTDANKTLIEGVGATEQQKLEDKTVEELAKISTDEIVAQVTTNKNDIASQKESLDELSSEVTTNTKSISEATRSLNALWKLNQGQTWDVEEETETGINDIPTGAKYESLEEVYGKSTQDSTNGYSLYGVNKTTTITNKGVSFTFDGTEEITVNGTSESGISYCYATLSNNGIGKELLAYYGMAANETYTMSIYQDSDLAMITCIFYDGTSVLPSGPATSSSVTFTVPSTATEVYFRVGSNGSDIAFDNYKVKIMLESGSTAHDWEPYTGGIPSPNPSYPQEITDVTQEVITVNGTNLLKNIQTSKTYTGVTFTIQDDGSIIANGTATTSMNFLVGKVDLKANRTYNLVGCPSGGSWTTYSVRFGSGTLADRGSGYTYTPTEDETQSININFQTNAVATNVIFKPMVTLDTSLTYDDFVTYEEPLAKTLNYILRSVGDVHDVLSKSGITRNVGNVDLGTLTYSMMTTNTSDIYRIRSALNVSSKGIDVQSKPNLLCDKYISKSANETYRCTQGINVYGLVLIVYDPNYNTSSSASAFKESVNGAILNYELATPITESITDEDVEFLESLELLSTDHTINIVDQNGNDISYLVEYLVKLSEVA